MAKINYLEGVRGICCLTVIFDHCVNRFFPSLRYTNEDGLVGMVKDIIAYTPLNVLYSGVSSVYMFFILSGFVLAHKFNKTKDYSVLAESAVKRYPRLIIPVFFSMLVMFFCI